MSTPAAPLPKPHRWRTVGAVLLFPAATAAIIALIAVIGSHVSTEPAVPLPPMVTYGQTYDFPGAGLRVTITAPVSDGRGHATVRVTEENQGYYPYRIQGQTLQSDDQVQTITAGAYAPLYPGRSVTFTVEFDAPDPTKMLVTFDPHHYAQIGSDSAVMWVPWTS